MYWVYKGLFSRYTRVYMYKVYKDLCSRYTRVGICVLGIHWVYVLGIQEYMCTRYTRGICLLYIQGYM